LYNQALIFNLSLTRKERLDMTMTCKHNNVTTGTNFIGNGTFVHVIGKRTNDTRNWNTNAKGSREKTTSV